MLKKFEYKNCFIYLLLFLTTIFVFSNLGSVRMLPIDDCYYAQKAKEIIRTGDWLTIHYGGNVSIDNAPLYIWMIALMFKLFGINEYSARFVSAFFSVASVAGVFFLGKMLYNNWIGLFSSFVLIATPLFFIYSRRTMVDVTFTFWFTLAMISLIKGMEERKYFLLFGISTGITILIKTVFGFFPIIISIIYLFMQKDNRKISGPFFVLGVLPSLIIGFPWFIFQYFTYPEQFVQDHLNWVILMGVFADEKNKPLYWYLEILLVYYWPWLPFAIYSFIKLSIQNFKKPDPNSLILLCWASTIIGVMSFMDSKKLQYIISAFPPLAILAAVSINQIMAKDKIRLYFTRGCFFVMLLTAIVVTATPLKLPFNLEKHKYFVVDEVVSIAEFAKKNIPENDKVILYKMWLWRIRSSFLFYSDRDVYASVAGKNQLAKILNKGEIKYCLTEKKYLHELSTLNLRLLKETPSLVLLTTN